jgi:hypothetical protein
VQQIAFNLQVAVATQGRVQVTSMPPSSETSAGNIETSVDASKCDSGDKTVHLKTETTSATRPLIEVIDDGLASSSSTADNEKVDTNKDVASNSAFLEALEMLKDPLIPVQGHGMICMRRLIEKGDKDAVDSSDMLLKLCFDNITHSDSYIYLNAVQLMAALVIRFPKNFLPRLIQEYLRESSSDRLVSADCRMKLGEVLVKTSAALGEFGFTTIKLNYLSCLFLSFSVLNFLLCSSF